MSLYAEAFWTAHKSATSQRITMAKYKPGNPAPLPVASDIEIDPTAESWSSKTVNVTFGDGDDCEVTFTTVDATGRETAVSTRSTITEAPPAAADLTVVGVTS